GTKDNPIYEAEFGSSSKGGGEAIVKKDEHRHLNQFIVHSALDVVEEMQWNTNTMYLKSVDKFNEWHVSAHVTAGNIKFMLLHETKSEDVIRNFFSECYELYIKVLLNPFYELNLPITSPAFDNRVRVIAKKYLGKE
ncbi:8525_t:CDS:2, partial [Ambispora gerdemannii]